MPRTLLVAPAGRQVGVTTVCLGLVRALNRLGVRVAFTKPIAARGENRAATLVKLGAHLEPPEPIARAAAEDLLATGDDQTLMERVVALCTRAAEGADVLVVEGLAPEPGHVYSTRVNALMLKALDAELVLVGSPRGETPADFANAVAIAARGLGADLDGRGVDCILNRVTGSAGGTAREVEGRTHWFDAAVEAEDVPAASSTPMRRRSARRSSPPSASSRRAATSPRLA